MPDPTSRTRVGGEHTGGLQEAARAANIDPDIRQLDKLHRFFKDFNQTLTATADALVDISSKVGTLANATSGVQGPAPSKAKNGQTNPPPAPTSPVVTPLTQGSAVATGAGVAATATGNAGARADSNRLLPGQSFFGLRALAQQYGGPGVVGVGLAGIGAGQLVGQMDARIDRGAQYALPADRLNVYMQQQYGISQGQAIGMRQPLTNYRLGAGGVSAILKYQADMNINDRSMGQSVEGVRALSGWSKSTQDVLADQSSIMQADTANRMLYMLGTNAYTSGGGTKDIMQTRQDIVKSMGLANDTILKGAFLPGSVTRKRLEDAGLGQEMQDEVLSYARAQSSWQKAGHEGMYDPSNRKHTELMGIEDNFATQSEETDRLRTRREENFLKSQADNLASMERNTQTMVELLTNIDSMFEKFVGARMATRGYQRLLGRGLQIAGIGLMATGVGGMGGALAFGAGTALSGDPVDADGGPSGGGPRGSTHSGNDANITVPTWGGPRTLNAVKQMPSFKGMHPNMQDRVLRMMRENPRVGFGEGVRSVANQEKMFLERYRPTSKQTRIFWRGTYWEHVRGAAAAPPGRSMHGVGLAADLTGDTTWVTRNAHRFGLVHFAQVNNEPWHVQPAELPNGFGEYEKQGFPWGTGSLDLTGEGAIPHTGLDGAPVTGEAEPGHTGGGAPHGGGGGEHTGVAVASGGFSGLDGMSISDVISSMQEQTRGFRAGHNVAYGASDPTRGKVATDAASTVSVHGTGAELAARAGYAAGFRGDELVTMVAIAGRESNWQPELKAKNSDDWGMWQINGVHMKWLPQIGITEKPQLLDVNNNARAAFKLKRDNGYRPWRGSSNSQYLIDIGKGPAGWDPDGDHLWRTENRMPAASAAVAALNIPQSGDPAYTHIMPSGGPPVPGGTHHSSATVAVSPSYSFNIAPNISLHTNGSTPSGVELRRIAQQVSALIKEELQTAELRTA
jgi:hypothetical protein